MQTLGMMCRRAGDRLMLVFIVVSLLAAVGIYVNLATTWTLVRRIEKIEDHDAAEDKDRDGRRKTMDQWRSQMLDAGKIRDNEIDLIKKRLEQIERPAPAKRKARPLTYNVVPRLGCYSDGCNTTCCTQDMGCTTTGMACANDYVWTNP